MSSIDCSKGSGSISMGSSSEKEFSTLDSISFFTGDCGGGGGDGGSLTRGLSF